MCDLQDFYLKLKADATGTRRMSSAAADGKPSPSLF